MYKVGDKVLVSNFDGQGRTDLPHVTPSMRLMLGTVQTVQHIALPSKRVVLDGFYFDQRWLIPLGYLTDEELRRVLDVNAIKL